MKKILLIVRGNKSWIGGVYYIKNVCYMLLQNSFIINNYDISILCEKSICEEFNSFRSKCEIVEVERMGSFPTKLKLIKLCLFDQVKTIYTSSNNPIYQLLKVTPINWIPDFQHKHYPQYFRKEQLESRNKSYGSTISSGMPFILSSNNAQDDCKKYYNTDKGCIFIMHFVSYIEDIIKSITPELISNVLNEYNLGSRKYILVSNQFWQHKNHKVVFEMIVKAKQKKLLSEYKFVFTGELEDFRNPEHVQGLKSVIAENHLQKKIDILGFIDRQKQIILMKESILLIQPSLFEGWGTVVEDGKVLDKTMLLSDIPLHYEQKNDKCTLFKATNSDDLLDKLIKLVEKVQPDDIDAGIVDMQRRAMEYSKSFEQILKEV